MKIQTDTWYSEHLADYDDQIADGKFCNDRNTVSGYTWSASGSVFYYTGYERLQTNKMPTLDCSDGDVYTLKVGAITADEVSFAGGVWNIANSKYYLYNGQYYWTMSPYIWGSIGGWANVFAVHGDGQLWGTFVNYTVRIRPVINLKADTAFSSGDGSQSSPFVVAD